MVPVIGRCDYDCLFSMASIALTMLTSRDRKSEQYLAFGYYSVGDLQLKSDKANSIKLVREIWMEMIIKYNMCPMET